MSISMSFIIYVLIAFFVYGVFYGIDSDCSDGFILFFSIIWPVTATIFSAFLIILLIMVLGSKLGELLSDFLNRR